VSGWVGVWPLPNVNPPQAPTSSYKQMQKTLPEACVQDVGSGIAGQSQTKPVVVLLKPELQGFINERWDDRQTTTLQRVEVRVKWPTKHIKIEIHYLISQHTICSKLKEG